MYGEIIRLQGHQGNNKETLGDISDFFLLKYIEKSQEGIVSLCNTRPCSWGQTQSCS